VKTFQQWGMAALIVVCALGGLAYTVWFATRPCDFYRYMPANDVPFRCFGGAR